MALASVLLQFFGVTEGQPNAHLVTSPNYHTAVTVFGGGALHMGHTLVCMDAWNSETALALTDRYQCTNTHMVPTQFKRMLSLPDDVKASYDLSSMRWLIHAAAPCPIGIKQQMLDWWGRLRLGVLRGHRGRRDHRLPAGLARPSGHRRQRVADQRAADRRRERRAAADRPPGTIYMKMGVGTFEYYGDQEKTNGEPAARLLHRRRHRLPGRGRLPVPVRPQVRHDHLGRRQHLPGRDRGRDHHEPQGRRRGGLRYPRRRLGRADQGRRAAGRRSRARRRARGGDPGRA